DLEAHVLERVDNIDLVAAGGFQADTRDTVLSQPAAKLGVALTVAPDVQFKLLRPHSGIEPFLADIDAGSQYYLCHLPIASLQIRSWRPCNCSGCEDESGVPSSPSAFRPRAGTGSPPPGPAWSPPRRPTPFLARFPDTRAGVEFVAVNQSSAKSGTGRVCRRA